MADAAEEATAFQCIHRLSASVVHPRCLRQQIYDDLDNLLKLPGAVPGCSENVHQTLAYNQQKGNLDLLFDLAFNRTEVKAR
jgi:hypothetical protein